MTNEEAKQILSAYRLRGQDAKDPFFSAALEKARTDPSLQVWLEREQGHGRMIADKLHVIAPPPGLREAVLRGAPSHRRARTENWWSLRPVWLAAAASVAILLSVTFFRSAHDGTTDPLTEMALDDVAHGRHGGHGAATSALQAELGATTTRLGAGLALDFAGLKSTGCRTLSIAGHDVLEVCFVRNGAEFHLYVTSRSDFPARAGGKADFVQRGALGVASWADATFRFVVVSDAGLEKVKGLL